jgi:predicted Zn-dependent protease with MMP-like domain
MSPIEFDAIVDDVLEQLPEWVLEEIDNLVVVVEEEPTAEQDPDGSGLLGLYEGVNLAERDHYFGAMPDRITIFRRPHLRLGLDRTDLAAEIRATVLHEVAHHIGIDDERLHELGWD